MVTVNLKKSDGDDIPPQKEQMQNEDHPQQKQEGDQKPQQQVKNPEQKIVDEIITKARDKFRITLREYAFKAGSSADLDLKRSEIKTKTTTL